MKFYTWVISLRWKWIYLHFLINTRPFLEKPKFQCSVIPVNYLMQTWPSLVKIGKTSQKSLKNKFAMLRRYAGYTLEIKVSKLAIDHSYQKIQGGSLRLPQSKSYWVNTAPGCLFSYFINIPTTLTYSWQQRKPTMHFLHATCRNFDSYVGRNL